jgi:DNA-binding LacI/PurR family transcriptional regulator
VFVNARIDDLEFATVSTDDAAAAEQAVIHLHQLGHRRIGMLLGPADHVPSQRKLAAARRVLEELGSPLSEDLVARGLYSLESGQAGATRLMAAGATAIVCASDPLALGAVRAARRQGRSVPADLSVVGFDDSALMSCTEPPLTTVRQPIESMGRTVIELLLAQIQTGAGAGDELLFEPELVLRASTAPLTA